MGVALTLAAGWLTRVKLDKQLVTNVRRHEFYYLIFISQV